MSWKIVIGFISSWILLGGWGVIGNLNLVVEFEEDCIGMFTIEFTATCDIREKSSCVCIYLLLVYVGQGENLVKLTVVEVAL